MSSIGTDCMLCGQVALAGSVVVGDGAVLGGRVGVADHLSIGAGAVVGRRFGGRHQRSSRRRLSWLPAVPRQEAMENLKLMRRVETFSMRSEENEAAH